MIRLARNILNRLRGPAPAAPTSSWDLCREYVQADPSAILAPSSNVLVPYRPLQPGVVVTIGAESQIFGTLVVQRPGAFIHIGCRTQIGASHLIAACGIEIGDDVLMAWDIVVMDNDSHSLNWKERQDDVRRCGIDYRQTPQDIARTKDWSVVPMMPVRICNRAWVGFGVAILKGVTIGEGAVIGARSVVTRDVRPYSLAAGNPARVVRTLPESGEARG